MPLVSLLEHDVCVRSADAESADAGAAGPAVGLPFGSLVVDQERTVLEVEVRIRPVEMKRRRKHAMSHNMRGVDQTGHARGNVQMSDIGLHRADRAKLLAVRSCAKSLGQACKLDRIAQRRPGSV